MVVPRLQGQLYSAKSPSHSPKTISIDKSDCGE